MTIDEIGKIFYGLRKYLSVVIYNHLDDACPKHYTDDCLQETFRIALEKRFDPKFNRNPKAWLVVAAKHVVDNFNRTYKTYEKHHAYDEEALQIPYSQDLIEDMAFKLAIESHVLERIKRDLSRDDALFFKMRFEYNMEVADIARELQMRDGAVHTRISRVKKKVKDLINVYTN